MAPVLRILKWNQLPRDRSTPATVPHAAAVLGRWVNSAARVASEPHVSGMRQRDPAARRSRAVEWCTAPDAPDTRRGPDSALPGAPLAS